MDEKNNFNERINYLLEECKKCAEYSNGHLSFRIDDVSSFESSHLTKKIKELYSLSDIICYRYPGNYSFQFDIEPDAGNQFVNEGKLYKLKEQLNELKAQQETLLLQIDSIEKNKTGKFDAYGLHR